MLKLQPSGRVDCEISAALNEKSRIFQSNHINYISNRPVLDPDSNLERRQLNDFQIIELELIKEPILKERARKNNEITQFKPKDSMVCKKVNTPLGRVDEQIGKRAKRSGSFYKVTTI